MAGLGDLMDGVALVQWLLLLIVTGLLLLDLRASVRVTATITGVVGLCGRQISHCDGCRRAVLVTLRPWIALALPLALTGLVMAPVAALLLHAPQGVPGPIASGVGALCVALVLAGTQQGGRRARGVTGHDAAL